jgi:cell division protein FtsX
MIKKSQPFVYLLFLIGIFCMGLAWVLLSKPMAIVYNNVYNNSDVLDEEYQNFFTKSKTIWGWILLPCGFSMLLYSIIEIHRKNSTGEF